MNSETRLYNNLSSNAKYFEVIFKTKDGKLITEGDVMWSLEKNISAMLSVEEVVNTSNGWRNGKLN